MQWLSRVPWESHSAPGSEQLFVLVWHWFIGKSAAPFWFFILGSQPNLSLQPQHQDVPSHSWVAQQYQSPPNQPWFSTCTLKFMWGKDFAVVGLLFEVGVRMKTFPCHRLVSPSHIEARAGKRKLSTSTSFPKGMLPGAPKEQWILARLHATLPSSTCPRSTMLPKHSQMFSTTFPKHQRLYVQSPGPDLQHAVVAGWGRRDIVFGSGLRWHELSSTHLWVVEEKHHGTNAAIWPVSPIFPCLWWETAQLIRRVSKTDCLLKACSSHFQRSVGTKPSAVVVIWSNENKCFKLMWLSTVPPQ